MTATRGSTPLAGAGPRPLAGRTALITGGSRGIGAAVTRALANRGADVVLTYRSEHAAAAALAEHCRSSAHVAAHPLCFDTTVPAAAQGLLEAVGDLAAAVDVLVINAAAPFSRAPLTQLPSTTLISKISTDLEVVHQLVTGLAPGMLERGFGRVVVIGSLHAEGPSAPGMAANGVAKAALAAYVDYAVDELTGPGVTINTVHPGYIATEGSSGVPPAIPALLARLTPAARAGRPDDVAAVVAMLTSPEAEFLNGARIPVTGGLNHPLPLRRVLSAEQSRP